MSQLFTHRKRPKSEVAVVFVHGFLGDIATTWGDLPKFIEADSQLTGWDIYSVGYPTSPGFDLEGLWSADPGLANTATYLRTVCTLEPMKNYKALALVGHSMGGLVIQRALIDSAGLDGFRNRVGHVVLYGTPSNGLKKASWFSRWKRQIRDMGEYSDFIKDLRARWAGQFPDKLPFRFKTVAGMRDDFVPSTSSLDPFPESARAIVPGNHLQIVKPNSDQDESVRLLVDMLAGKAAGEGPLNSARLAVEARNFQSAVDVLLPKVEVLDPDTRAQLALALEGLGRGKEALALLEKYQSQSSTDAMGVLAGRLKRRYVLEGVKTDAEAAYRLYSEAYAESARNKIADQAYYHGINMAFLEFFWKDDPELAMTTAKRVLDHCKDAKPSVWRSATEGEAHLLLGNLGQALDYYDRAVQAADSPWKVASMHQQASLIARRIDKSWLGVAVEHLFNEAGTKRIL
jgi:pimeloyl-ACP methyl ester carboxylesterase